MSDTSENKPKKSANGKGDDRRPAFITPEEYAENYYRIHPHKRPVEEEEKE